MTDHNDQKNLIADDSKPNLDALMGGSPTVPPVSSDHGASPPPQPPPTPPGEEKKPKGVGFKLPNFKNKTALVVILLMLLTLPIATYFVSQQNQLGDIRNRAASGCELQTECEEQDPYATCPGTPIKNCPTNTPKITPDPETGWTYGCSQACRPGYFCYGYPGGDACIKFEGTGTQTPTGPTTTTTTTPPTTTQTSTPPPGGGTSTPPPGGGTNPPPTNSPTNPPPTATPIVGQCDDIRIYKNGQIVDPNTLLAGDVVEVRVVGTNATQARIRVNGGNWQTTSTKNSAGHFIFTLNVQNTGSYTIESEVFVAGQWR